MGPDRGSVRRLVLWNRFWLCVVSLALLLWGGTRLLDRHVQNHRTLQAHWEGSDLRLTSTSDGPFVVTHLVSYSSPRVARLPEPLAIIDSHGGRITADVLMRLTWTDHMGNSAQSPPAGTPIRALYYCPQTTEPANQD